VSDDEELEYIQEHDDESPPSKRPRYVSSAATPRIDLTDQIKEDKKGSQVEHDENLARMQQETYDSTNYWTEVNDANAKITDNITDSLFVVTNLAQILD
jgi:hypothetical protein